MISFKTVRGYAMCACVGSSLLVAATSHAARHVVTHTSDKTESMFVFKFDSSESDEQDTAKPKTGDEVAKKEARREVLNKEIFIRQAHVGNSPNGLQMIRMGEKTVKNAPYSAEVITENQQKLADGNLISSKVSMLTYRDSQGRTREEIRDAKGEVRTIIIHDPEVGRIILNPKSKTAVKMMSTAPLKDGSKMASANVTENVTKSADGREVIELKLAGEGDKQGERHVVVRRITKSADGKVLAGDVEKNMTVDIRGPELGRNMEMQLGGAMFDTSFTRIFSDAKWAAKRQTKTLGSRDFDGIKAEGKNVSYEIPAGEIGNAKPIIVNDESWTSPDLQITVYSKHSDPRSGERVYRLSNVNRDEVPASMFTVPSDYKLSDVSKDVGKAMKFDFNDRAEKGDKAERLQKIEKEIRIEKK